MDNTVKSDETEGKKICLKILWGYFISFGLWLRERDKKENQIYLDNHSVGTLSTNKKKESMADHK